MSKFTKRQANGLNRFFDSLNVPESRRDARNLFLMGCSALPEASGTCEVCGHSPIKYEFRLAYSNNKGILSKETLVAGSECVTSFMGANLELVHLVNEKKKALIQEAKKERAKKKREEAKIKNLADLNTAINMIETLRTELINLNLNESISVDFIGDRCLVMLEECRTHGYPFTEGRREWARGIVRQLRNIIKSNQGNNNE